MGAGTKQPCAAHRANKGRGHACRYTELPDGLIGPWRAGREPVKTQLFRDLQRRGFRLFCRWRPCAAPLEPAAVEAWLLQRIDYAGNERGNRGYRQLFVRGSDGARTPLARMPLRRHL